MNHRISIFKRILYTFLAFVLLVSQPMSSMQMIAYATEVENTLQEFEENSAEAMSVSEDTSSETAVEEENIEIAEEGAKIEDNGSRLIVTGFASDAKLQWYRCDTEEGEYVAIEGATDTKYDLTEDDSNKFIRAGKVGEGDKPSTWTDPVKKGNVYVFDLANGNIEFNSNCTYYDDSKTQKTVVHEVGNIYVVMQTGSETTSTENGITFKGQFANDDLVFDVTIDGLNILAHLEKEKLPNSSYTAVYSSGNINILGESNKHVVLRLKGDNSIRNLHYDTHSNRTSSLKITSINGDGDVSGGALYVPKKFIDDEDLMTYVNSKNTYNHWNSGIGGDDSGGVVTGLEIAGGFVQSVTSYGDNCSAIGGGGNDHCQMKITGGKVRAICNGTGAAIGGGIGWNSAGGTSDIEISGGEVYAYNYGNIYLKETSFVTEKDSYDQILGGVAIGSGSSFHQSGSTGTVKITGGRVEAYGTFGNGIGGGNSSEKGGGAAKVTVDGENAIVITNALGGGSSFKTAGGNAEIILNAGNVTATSLATGIGGGNSKVGNGGSATVKISGNVMVNLEGGIGGGSSENGDGGGATIEVSGGTLNCNGNIGGGNGKKGTLNTAKGGDATIKISGGILNCSGNIGGGTGGEGYKGGDASIYVYKNSGDASLEGTLVAKAIGGGTGGTGGNGGAATIEIHGGTVRSGSIGGGNAGEGGKIGYATADITGGNIQGQFLMAAGGTNPCYFKMSGGTLHGVNTADSSVYAYAQENGAVVYMDDPEGSVSISGGTIEECTAVDGGAIYMTAGTFTISGDAVIQNCTATGEGGAVYLGGGDVFVNGGSIIDNTATGNGGAIAINNGNYRMIGGNVDSNKSLSGAGGAIYVSANGKNVTVDVLSGSVSRNESQGNGGALAVVGKTDGAELINVTIGVDAEHTATDEYNCHTIGGEDGLYRCPVMIGNHAKGTGGAVYVTGNDQTKLNIYCLEESESTAQEDNGQANFMKMEGGQVLISTTKVYDEKQQTADNGNVEILSTIYVTGGKMDLWGDMTNPLIDDVMTVDIKKDTDHFLDHRVNDKFYKLIYFENFTDPITGFSTGQYKEVAVKRDEKIIIAKNIYSHPGYQIQGWNTDPDQKHNWEPGTNPEAEDPRHGWYEVNSEQTFDGEPLGDLTIYAIWSRNAYTIHYDPNVDSEITGAELMTDDIVNYDIPFSLKKNQFGYPGYIFTEWNTESDGSGTPYADEAEVKNLAQLNGDMLTLYAQWEKCEHDPEKHKKLDGTYACWFTLTVTGEDEHEQTLVKECSCKGYRETYMLSAQDTTYNRLEQPAEIIVLPETLQTVPVITYVKVVNGVETPLENGKEPINAGTYKASILVSALVKEKDADDKDVFRVGEKTAEVIYVIDKAQQPAPAKPIDYTPNIEEGKSTLEITRVADSPIRDQSSALYDESYNSVKEYKIAYYQNDTLHEVPGTTYGWQDTNKFELNVALTNYYIYARYSECDNYYASPETLADAVYFFEGNVGVHVDVGEGIDPKMDREFGVLDISDGNDVSKNGIGVIAEALDNYYLPNDYMIQAYAIRNDDSENLTLSVMYNENKKQYSVEEIPSACVVYITLPDAIKAPSIEAKVEEKQIFDSVSKESATITCDSAYTAYFNVKNMNSDYSSDWKVKFDKNLPVGTTLIMLDKTSHVYYWKEVSEGNVASIKLNDFVRMGGGTTDVFSLPTEVQGEKTIFKEEIELQFIVDFSEVRKEDHIVSTSDSEIEMLTWLSVEKLSADGVNEDALQIINDDPDKDVGKKAKTTLKAVDEFEIIYTESNVINVEQPLTLKYKKSEGVSSIWDNRQGALVLSPISPGGKEEVYKEIPSDSYIKYQIGSSSSDIYKNSDGKYIIPLGDLSNADLKLTLISNLFPEGLAKYRMKAEWIAADSIAESTPYRGDVVAANEKLVFSSLGSTPAIRITTEENLYTTNDTVHVTVAWRDMTKHELTVSLKTKNNSGEFVDTGLKQKIDTKIEGVTEFSYDINLGGLGAGSYCLESEVMYNVLLVKDAITKCYFIVE